MENKKIIKSKRLKITTYALIGNFILLTVGIFMKSDLVALGTAIAMISSPLYGYLWGETTRPSGTQKIDVKNQKK